MLLLEQLTGQQEESEVFELFGSEEPQPMEKPSIKSRFFSGVVAEMGREIYSTTSKIILSKNFPVCSNFCPHSFPSGVSFHQPLQVSMAA